MGDRMKKLKDVKVLTPTGRQSTKTSKIRQPKGPSTMSGRLKGRKMGGGPMAMKKPVKAAKGKMNAGLKAFLAKKKKKK